uniref:Copper type II ascorbate-dependent monooxygenase C-terminal domain-containing protein n=1 Tax=Chrysotila carterae TaxID=13221 RepID=A0A7S4EUW3_CHRCT
MGDLLYAWARTGQKTPIGLDFNESGVADAAYAVGAGTDIEWLALQVHYQQMEPQPVTDSSGIKLWFHRDPPRFPLKFEILMSTRLVIPPRVVLDECVTCRVRAGGQVIAFRNHAHRLARDIWSDHWDANGTQLDSIGRLSAQEPQIIRHLPKVQDLRAGDTLQLHCMYDARHKNEVTTLGLDERTREMCNQYYVSSASLRFDCGAERLSPLSLAFDHVWASAERRYVIAESSPAAAVQIGQVPAVALDPARNVYFFHRGAGGFFSKGNLDFDPIVRLDSRGRLVSSFGRELFAVPHGLYADASGALWATDVGAHTVLKLDPLTGKVLMRLGTPGKPGAGTDTFNKPTDVAVDPSSGEVYVSDGYGNSRIIVFSAQGVYLRQWGSHGSGQGQFNVPHSITLDTRGRVYVADRENARIQVFTTKGDFVAEWPSRVGAFKATARIMKEPFRAHVSSIFYSASLDIFVVTEGAGVVLRSPSGCEVAQNSGMNWPHDAIILPTGNSSKAVLAGERGFVVVVAELDGKKLQWFKSDPRAAARQSMYG